MTSPTLLEKSKESTALPKIAGAGGYEELEHSVEKDLGDFWIASYNNNHPTSDGFHRTALLCKVFDYVGRTRKQDKLVQEMQNLDCALFRSKVFKTKAIQPNQRTVKV